LDWRLLPSVRHRLSQDLYRIPDVAVYEGEAPPDGQTPDQPPYVVIEVVSPDDRYTAIVEKLEGYRTWGVPHVWSIDLQTRKFAVYGSDGLMGVSTLRLPDYGLEITSAELFPR
jgi:Uma2 family endonuclease